MANSRMFCAHCEAETPPETALCPSCGKPPGHLIDENDPGSLATAAVSPDIAATAFAPGEELAGRYTVVERVGSGGMGYIYKAIDRRLGRPVALKLIQAGASAPPQVRERFRRELNLALQVSHTNVCNVYDLGEIDGQLFISMEYVEGQTLEDLIHSVGSLSPSQTATLGRQICAGLAAIHERGIIHRDLKPGNIMVDHSGQVRLMDFGVAYKPDQDRLTASGAILGTLAYLAPEQGRGRVEPRTDLYALGLILYEMLTARRPPGDEGPLPLALRDAKDACPPPSHFAPEVPPLLDRIIMRCLERDPARRFDTAEELSVALAQFAGTLEIAPRQPYKPPRSGWKRAAAALGLIAILGLGSWGLSHLWTPTAPAGPVSVAFLPLDYSGSEESSYLRHMLPVVLANDLRHTPGLDVVPFSTSRTFAPDEDPRSVARQLGVGFVVGGRLGVESGRIHGSLRLVTETGEERWAHELSGSVNDLVRDSTALAETVARSLSVRRSDAAIDHRVPDPLALKHYLEGLTYLEGWDVLRSIDQAVEAFERAIATQPDFAEAHAGIARAYWRRYRDTRDPSWIERAERAAMRAAELAPHLPEAQLTLGVMLLARGRSAEAATALEKAQRLAPANEEVLRRIARAYDQLGRPDAQVAELYQRAIDARPGFWQTHNSKGAYHMRRGEAVKALPLFRKVIELRPERRAGYLNLGAALLQDGRHAEAEAPLRAALRVDPSALVHNNLGFVYYATGRYRAATTEFRAALGAGSVEAETYSNLADAYRQLDRRVEARDAYARALELWNSRLDVRSEDAAARAGSSVALAGLGHCDAARSQIQRTKKEAARQPAIAYSAAVASAMCGDREAAIEHVLAALDGGFVSDIASNPDLRPLLTEPKIRNRTTKTNSG